MWWNRKKVSFQKSQKLQTESLHERPPIPKNMIITHTDSRTQDKHLLTTTVISHVTLLMSVVYHWLSSTPNLCWKIIIWRLKRSRCHRCLIGGAVHRTCAQFNKFNFSTSKSEETCDHHVAIVTEDTLSCRQTKSGMKFSRIWVICHLSTWMLTLTSNGLRPVHTFYHLVWTLLGLTVAWIYTKSIYCV